MRQATDELRSSAQTGVKRGPGRSRLYFLSGLVLVLAIGGFFAYETTRALRVRSITGSEFASYVIQQHIGTADISDDASGFQPDFCVLHLKTPIATSRLQSSTMQLMKQYNSLDGGTSLTVEYTDKQTGKTVVQATAVYDATANVVHLTLENGSSMKQLNQQVGWNNGTS